MTRQGTEEATRLLRAVSAGDREAAEELAPIVYEEFRRIAERAMAREGPDHTLQPTALVNECYLRLIDQDRVKWRSRTHFFAIGARAMRRILVDHARKKLRDKRGGGRHRITLDEAVALSARRDEDVLAVDEALTELVELDPRQAEIVELRFFGGLTMAEVAESLGVSKRTVEADWTMVRAWLRRKLSEEHQGESA